MADQSNTYLQPRCTTESDSQPQNFNTAKKAADRARQAIWRKSHKAQSLELGWKHQGIKLSYRAYLNRYRKQAGTCAICGVYKPRLCVDHNHVTGKVRGLLCVRCNSGIGFLQDSPELLKKATDYVARGTNKGVARTL